ncbi:hypothetical protein J6590_049702 [Homalodisca vitripennis]|nr:hypothetical protein J6590_049702 [Homalodisca vitripennis]
MGQLCGFSKGLRNSVSPSWNKTNLDDEIQKRTQDRKWTVDAAEKGSPESQPKNLKTTPENWKSWLRRIVNFSGSVQMIAPFLL